MRPRRPSALPRERDPEAWSGDGMDVTFDLLEDSPPPPRTHDGPLTVCLACGAPPLPDPECPHTEVAHMDHAPAALHTAAATLRDLVMARHAQARVFRKLAAAEVSLGRGEIAVATRPQSFHDAPPPPAPPLPVAACTAPCAHCTAVLPARSRRRGIPQGQGAFAFAVPPDPPAPPVPVPETVPETVAVATTETPAAEPDAPAVPRRRRAARAP